MTPQFKVEVCQFDPEQFEKLSGLDRTMQRNWRRRGYIADREGPVSSFDAFDAASARLMLGNPAKLLPVANVASRSIVFAALANHPHTWSVGGAREQARQFRKELEKIGHSHLNKMAKISDGGAFLFSVIPDQGEPYFANNLTEAFQSNAHGKATVIDLEFIGNQLARSSQGQPLFRILPTRAK